MFDNLDWLVVIGDAVWILVLSSISGSSRAAWQRIKPTARVPMQFTPKKTVLWRAPKPVALLWTPVLATAVGLGLGWAARSPAYITGAPLIIFGVRMLLAPPFLMLHLFYLKLALEALAEEGELVS